MLILSLRIVEVCLIPNSLLFSKEEPPHTHTHNLFNSLLTLILDLPVNHFCVRLFPKWMLLALTVVQPLFWFCFIDDVLAFESCCLSIWLKFASTFYLHPPDAHSEIHTKRDANKQKGNKITYIRLLSESSIWWGKKKTSEKNRAQNHCPLGLQREGRVGRVSGLGWGWRGKMYRAYFCCFMMLSGDCDS